MWVERDLVMRNWPLWELSVNGERIFQGDSRTFKSLKIESAGLHELHIPAADAK